MTTQNTAVNSATPRVEQAGDGFPWLALVCMAAALIYALLAGLRTVSDFDIGWQLATGRWIAQHHTIPSTDVFSYTAAGQPWIYPVGSSLLFYGSYLLGGYALLSGLGSLACAGTAALLLRRGSIVSVALAVLAIPLIALRTAPRADMFTVVLFAAFARILWEQHQSGRVRLWLLPLLMMLWVNLHLGFVAGLALLGGYVALELLDAIVRGERRSAALARLRQFWPWLVATLLATLLNPWGWKIYLAILRQESAMTLHSQMIMEWSSVRLSWHSLLGHLSMRDPKAALDSMLLVAGVTSLIALWRRRIGAAALLGGSAFVALRHIRFGALFAILVVIIGGSVLAEELGRFQEKIGDRRTSLILRAAAALLIAAVCVIRASDLVTDRTYFVNSDIASFGAGLSWWFPEGAAEFLDRTNPPGEIFNGYNEGGFVVWRLGQKHRDYIDGRAIPFGSELFNRSGKLLATPPDSPEWQQEAGRYHIQSIIVPLGRYFGVRAFPVFRQFCNSETWVPVYLDETSAVFMRRTAETQPFLEQHRISCSTAVLPASPLASSGSAAFNQWSNAAAVLHELGRDPEALAASDKAVAIFADSGYLHYLRGEVLRTLGNLRGAELEYLRATELQPNEVDWSTLAKLYEQEGRFIPAMEAWRRTAELSESPAVHLLALGYAALEARLPHEAVRAFDQAFSNYQKSAGNDNSFLANLAHGRALAWAGLDDINRAIVYEEETVRLTPERTEDWMQLADFYQRAGRVEDSKRARQRAAVPAVPDRSQQ